jgi:hypothetical protein
VKRAIWTTLLTVVLMAGFAIGACASEMNDAVAVKNAELAMATGDFNKAVSILNEVKQTPITEAYLRFCNTWSVSEEDNAFEKTKVYKESDIGKMGEITDAFVYFPNEVNEGTRYLVYYAGGGGGWLLRQDYAWNYCNKFEPNAICVFFKASGLGNIGQMQERTGIILKSAAYLTGVHPYKVTIISSSNGGYMTFYAAVYLYNTFSIVTDKICSLDMGLNWSKLDVLISEDEAQPLVTMQTQVYAFGRHDEIWSLLGAKQFEGYGVPLYEVACVNGDHERMTKIAFRNGTFSWAIGQIRDLDPWEYKITLVNFGES